MKKKLIFVQNNHGLTLIELLATIAIASIVLVLITTLLIATQKQNNMTQTHNAIRQEANFIITNLRNLHDVEPYTICYHTDKKIYLDNSLSSALAHSKYFFEDVVIKQEGNIIEATNKCIENIDIHVPIEVKFTIKDDYNNAYTIDTVIDRVAPFPETDTSN
ncbi:MULTISPECIES: PilW family protein [Bacillus]|uniref:PilW family protein n=1 Tax=Bacillus TaxID=1386 RepID=UPI0012FEAE40|nr:MULTISPECIES: prepilin-type N-terminal cleavage/methylation domain-containing protein [Bacillus]